MGQKRLWKIRRPLTSTPLATYRVAHRERGRVRVLGRLEGGAPHHTALDPFLSALLHDGSDGELLLVDVTTNAVVARRTVQPYSAKAGDRFR